MRASLIDVDVDDMNCQQFNRLHRFINIELWFLSIGCPSHEHKHNNEERLLFRRWNFYWKLRLIQIMVGRFIHRWKRMREYFQQNYWFLQLKWKECWRKKCSKRMLHSLSITAKCGAVANVAFNLVNQKKMNLKNNLCSALCTPFSRDTNSPHVSKMVPINNNNNEMNVRWRRRIERTTSNPSSNDIRLIYVPP